MKFVTLFISYLFLWGIGLSYLEGIVCNKFFNTNKGWIALNRKLRWRAVSAIILTLVIAFLFWGEKDELSLQTPFYWLVEAIGIFAGFYASPYVLRLLAKVWPILSAYADKLDAGKLDEVVDDVKEKLNFAKGKVVDTLKKEDEKHNTLPEEKDNRSFKDKMDDATKNL